MRIVLACVISALAVASPQAQTGPLEPGYGVYTRLFNTAAPSVASGIVLLHPYLGPVGTVTGLPPALSVTNSTLNAGANAILVGDDGSMLVSGIFRGVPTEIYHIDLVATAAVLRRTYLIGNAVPFSAIDQMAWLPNARVLFTHRGPVGSPTPLQIQGLAILDLQTGAVTSVPILNFPNGRFINCVATNRGGTVAYFGTRAGGGGLFSVPLPGGGAVTPLLPTFQSPIQQLAVDHGGMIHAATSTAGLWRINPVPPYPMALLLSLQQINGLCLEPVSGDLILMQTNAAAGTSSMFCWNTISGLIPVPGMSGVDSPTGIAVRASLVPFGTPAPSSNVQGWQVRPNPGGAPRIGNSNFSLTSTSSPGTAWAVMAFSAGQLPTPINTSLVTNLLLDPAMFLAATTLPPRTSNIVRLPLPATLQPGDFYVQVFTVNQSRLPLPGGEGLRIHIYP